jgi:hypothetical protein
MFERISNGFAMARSSWRVLMGDKKLLWFPVVSGILFIVVVASFFVPLAVLEQNGKIHLLDGNNNRPTPLGYGVIFAFYVISYFVIIFCNAALVSCALLRFNGESPSLGDGFRAAMSRLPQIFAWAVVSASVGLLLKIIENAHEKAGAFIASILGTAWSIMTYFVVPILVVEKVGPFEAVSRSISVMKRTWGEALSGKIGMGLFLFLMAIPIILLFVVAIVVMGSSHALGIVLLITAGIALLWYMAVSAAMHTVFMTAVYQYATTDRVPDGFERHTLAHAFAAKA